MIAQAAGAKPQMRPAAGAPCRWDLPPLRTTGELALWLGLPPNELAWFADCRGLEAKLPPGKLRHYRYRWQRKRAGNARLIEIPKQRLKSMQRHLLAAILNRIPPHEAAHGFRASRSILTFVTPHLRQSVVLRLDLRDFFATVGRARVLAIFLTAGYPEPVAQLLAGICTNAAPRNELLGCPGEHHPNPCPSQALYRQAHLPQGAPTSPALANLAAYRLDCRLTGLACATGAQYTRYADDLLFSGGPPFERAVDRFLVSVGAIAIEEGFEVHTRKTRVMRRSVSQRAVGLVLNDGTNCPRAAYDQLKAILHNCLIHGPYGQNRAGIEDFRAHLAGRIAHVNLLNPERGRKLRQDFSRIQW